MKKIPFNVDAYTARLIGRENLSKLESAVIELVKNAYDADANNCILYYESSTDTLYLADNGSGMTEDVIVNHWMTIGNSSKANNYFSKQGRIQTGSKGIGRFALDRISSHCEMLTKNMNDSIVWKVNWNIFSEHKKITETYAEIENVEYGLEEFISGINNKEIFSIIKEEYTSTGTIFKLNKLQDDWDNMCISKVRKSLQTLVPPSMGDAFKIYFFVDNMNKEDALLSYHNIDNYDYKIEFDCRDNGYINININRNEFDFMDEIDEIIELGDFKLEDKLYFNGKNINYFIRLCELVPGISDKELMKVGKFNGTLYFYKITTTKEDKQKYYYKDFLSRKNFAKDFGGIKIYRDKFKVRPYGDPGTSNLDWLMLSQRKSKSPAAVSHPTGSWKVRDEQMLGEVNISRLNIGIADQSNREGIVETKEFGYFKGIIRAIIELFEKDRQYVIRRLNSIYINKNNVEVYKKEVEDKISQIDYSNKYSNSVDLVKEETMRQEFIQVHKVKAIINDSDEKIKVLEDEIALLRALATTGIVTNAYIHELKSVTTNLFMDIMLAKEGLEIENLTKDGIKVVMSDIDSAYAHKEKLTSWFKVTIDSVREDRRKMKKAVINDLIGNLVKSLQIALKEKEIEINFIENSKIEYRCFSYEIESIINNLITNSVSAFESKVNRGTKKKIDITIEPYGVGFKIVYRDNGPGLDEAYKKNPYRILDSLETSKRNSLGEKVGTGMGMWIVSNILQEYGGKIDLNANNINSGFNITLYFKKRR